MVRGALLLSTLMAVLLVVAPAWAKSGAPKSGVYIVIMENPPAINYAGGLAGLSATKPGKTKLGKRKKINPGSAAVKKYTGFLKRNHNKALAAVGAAPGNKLYSYSVALNGFAAQLTPAQVREMTERPGVAFVIPDEMRYATTDSSPEFLGLEVSEGPWAKGYDGEDVVVGVIDTGIWPEHPSFADDGSYGPPPVTLMDSVELPACDFGATAHNALDEPFVCNNKLLGAREFLTAYRLARGISADEYDSARDDSGHGTHTASTAAGNAGVDASILGIPRGTISGIAPRARVIAYKALGNFGGYSSDLAAAIDQAVADGVDVINYSIGGGASLVGADDIAFLFAADAGIFATTSAGNRGPGPETIGGPGSVPWITTVAASTQERVFQGSVVLGDGRSYAGASLTGSLASTLLVDGADAGNEYCTNYPLLTDVAGKIALCRGGIVSHAAKSIYVQRAGGIGVIIYNNEDADLLAADTYLLPTVQLNRVDGLDIKAYIASSGATAAASLVCCEMGSWPLAPTMAGFLSRGPNPVAPDIIKPDITAPGVQILAGYSPTPDPGAIQGELFRAVQGTSMASPHVAGVFALIKQAHPDWSPAMARSALMVTASPDVIDNDLTTMTDPFDRGAGHLEPGGVWNKGSVAEPGLAYDAGLEDYLAFLCGAAPEGIANSAETCAEIESLGISTDASDLNLPSIAVADLPGYQTVVRRVTSVAKEKSPRRYEVSVEAPPGYSVTVEPSSLRLRRGESASYTVTIANQSAPLGAWRFGSLSWNEKNGKYSVYSPIAVRGQSFFAPDEVVGSGYAGSTSFEVKFGYSGAYSATDSGLQPAAVTSDTVVQDPDQAFDPNDGYSKLHEFTLSSVGHFRIALPPEATEAGADLDIYVYDPSGALVAQSAIPGTDELINIAAPVDGTWRVYVNGWETVDEDSNYSLYSWVFPLANYDSLVSDAPNAAVSGTTGSVELSWDGAAGWSLGYVYHNGDSGLMGVTFVEVDNR